MQFRANVGEGGKSTRRSTTRGHFTHLHVRVFPLIHLGSSKSRGWDVNLTWRRSCFLLVKYNVGTAPPFLKSLLYQLQLYETQAVGKTTNHARKKQYRSAEKSRHDYRLCAQSYMLPKCPLPLHLPKNMLVIIRFKR